MRKIRKITRDKKGIDTILAALLMVVIVVVAAVMVYAWSTGLLTTLLVQNPVPKESMNVESFAFASNTNLTLSVRNTGSVAIAFASYYVKDSNGNQYARLNWPTDAAGRYPASVSPNGLVSVNIIISTACGSSCTGATYQFSSGLSYSVTLVTTRNNQFQWSGQR